MSERKNIYGECWLLEQEPWEQLEQLEYLRAQIDLFEKEPSTFEDIKREEIFDLQDQLKKEFWKLAEDKLTNKQLWELKDSFDKMVDVEIATKILELRPKLGNIKIGAHGRMRNLVKKSQSIQLILTKIKELEEE